MVNIGGLAALATTILERYVGFWAAYLLPFCVMWVSILPLIVWRHKFSMNMERTISGINVNRADKNFQPEALQVELFFHKPLALCGMV